MLWAGLAQAQEESRPTVEGQPIPESGQQAGEGEGARQTQEEEAAPENISPALNQIESAIRDLIAQQRATQGQRPEDHEISDLEAQEGMAFWAQTMFWATLAAVIVTFAGIVLIARTLHHTRRAADHTEGMLGEARETTKAARAAVDEARAATEAANRAVEVTSDTAKRQLRAYISIIGGTVDNVRDGGRPISKVALKNCGQTPAYNVTGIVNSGFFEAPTPERYFEELPPDAQQRSMGTLGPGVDTFCPKIHEVVLDGQQMTQLNVGTAAIYVVGGITYEDAFGVAHYTNFRLMFSSDNMRLNDSRMAVCAQGNEAD